MKKVLIAGATGYLGQHLVIAFMDVAYQGNKNLLNETTNAGVARFLYISVFAEQATREGH